MIVQCKTCKTCYDDEYRWTMCPHDTFAANDGANNFAHHPESYRGDDVSLLGKFASGITSIPYVKARARRAA